MKVSLSIKSCEGSWNSKIQQIKSIPHDSIHVDYMDDFNLIEVLHLLSSFDEKFDIHIVSKNVETHVKEIIENSINARNIFIQSENVPIKDLENITLNNKVSLAIQIKSDLNKYQHILKRTSSVLLMTTIPGISGGSFDDSLYNIIPSIKKINDKLRIYVDGGVSSENFEKLIRMNIHTVVIGSYLAKSNSALRSFTNLRSNYTEDASILSISDPIMQHPTVSSDIFIDILEVMIKERSNYVFVTDDKKKLVGVVTDGDLKRFLLNVEGKSELRVLKVPVNDKFIFCHEDSTLGDLLNLKNIQISMGAIPIKNSDGLFKDAFKLQELLG